MFTYARKVREEVGHLIREHCFGCRPDHPSQRNHPCLMMSEFEHLNIYFDDAMENVKCEEVLNLWKKETQLTDISETLKDTFIKLLQNSKWQKKHLPSKTGFYDMVKRIILLD